MSRRKNMDKIINLVEQEIATAFDKAGYDRALAKVTLSNRPDLCEYQCNGAMAGAKKYKKAPFMIAEDVLANLTDKTYIGEIEVVKPGFINIKLNEDAKVKTTFCLCENSTLIGTFHVTISRIQRPHECNSPSVVHQSGRERNRILAETIVTNTEIS